MLFPVHLGMSVHQSGDTASPIPGPMNLKYGPGAPVAVKPSPTPSAPSPVPVHAPLIQSPQTEVPAASVPASSSVASAPASSSGSGTSSGSLPVLVSGIVDPVTGITYSGYLTPDAQTLYQNGSLVSGGNALTTQGSALAAQGDLITGTPAPTTAEVASASAIVWSSISFSPSARRARPRRPTPRALSTMSATRPCAPSRSSCAGATPLRPAARG